MEEELLIIPRGDELKSFRKKLNQDEEKIAHCLSLLLNWLSYQKHLPQNYDPNLLRNVIITCKNDLEKSKKKYEYHCYSKLIHKEFLGNRIITSQGDLRCLEYADILALPKITPDGCRLALVRARNMDEFQLMEIARYDAILMDYLFSRDTILSGIILIFDCEFVKPNHYSKIFTALLIKILKLGLAIYPLRMNKIVIMACDPFLEKGINICKRVLPPKVSDRITMIKDAGELQKLIPTSYLPSDYGGRLKSVKELSSEWRKCLLKNEEFLKNVHRDVPTGPIPKTFINYDNEFGIEGSFRKLNID